MCPASEDSGSDGSGGFFARWSRRKAQVRQGEPLPEPAPASASRDAARSAPDKPATPASSGSTSVAAPAVAPSATPAATDVASAQPAPTLEELSRLNPLDAQANFSRFIQPEVAPELKNAALKKLFTDPHFNVMDGLDVYIDDYSQPDPLPPGMLEQLQLNEYLGLREPAKVEEGSAGAEPEDPSADGPNEVSAAQASVETDPAPLPNSPELAQPIPDENADLRLQPNDAAGRPRPEPSAGSDAGRLG